MYLGAHVSIAKGFDKSIDRAVDLGANCLMTFASSPRSLQTKPFPENEIDSYLSKKSTAKMGPHFFHGVYLINLATNKPEHLNISKDSLIFYQKLAAQINAAGTIFHLGSHQGRGFVQALPQIVSALVQILKDTPEKPKLILENAAGHSGTIGSLDELSQIIHHPGLSGHNSRISICLDTQHAFASGIHLTDLLDLFDSKIGLEHLSVIHFNDSAVEFSANRDRHANIGEGRIGLSNLKIFLNDNRLKNIPFILEVPGESHSGPRKSDIESLKSLQN